MNNKKPKFNIADYLGAYAMHCSTEDQAKIFCKHLHGLGKTWNSFSSYLTHTNYDRNTVNTCYAFNSDLCSSVDYCKELGYTILEFEDFDWEE